MVIIAADFLKNNPRIRFMPSDVRLFVLRESIDYKFSTYEFHIEFAFDLDCYSES
jgi:hypothetical protein